MNKMSAVAVGYIFLIKMPSLAVCLVGDDAWNIESLR